MTADPRFIVVGGGITGLSAAHRLLELATQSGRRAEVILIEATQRIGGVFGTRHIGDYVIETGADSFITDRPWALNLCRRLGLESRLISIDPHCRRAYIVHRGRPVRTPEGFNLLAPSRLWPVLTTPLLSPLGKLRLLGEYFVRPRDMDGDEDLASFTRRRFGKQVLERIVQPMVSGIYTSDPEKLSLAATLPRFIEMERRHGSLIRAMRLRQREQRTTNGDSSGARYGLFASLAGGMSELLDALTERVRAQGRIWMDHAVTAVEMSDPDASSVRVTLSDGTVQHADGVVLALPAYRTADLIDSWAEDLAEELRGIEYASSAIVVTGHRLEDVAHPLDAAGMVVPHAERRNILAVSFLSRKFAGRAPTGRVVLRTFVGGAMQPELLEQEDAALAEIVLAELRELLGVRGHPDFIEVVRYHRAMPQYHVGHLERVDRIEQRAANYPRLALAGNACRGVGLPDCIHSGEVAAEKVWRGTVRVTE
jgi:oxygen-dependent protoporphyrinogen oxidase